MKPIKNMQDIKEQLTRACQIYQLYQLPRPEGIRSCLTHYIDDEMLIEDTGFRPTPEEIDDADIVQFEWMPILMPEDRQLIWKRFSGMGWKRLAYEMHISERTARTRISKSLNKLLDKLTS